MPTFPVMNRSIRAYFPSISAVTLSCHIAMVVIVGILYAAGYNIFPVEFSTLPLELYDIPYRLRDYAWRDRDTFTNRVNRTLSDTGLATYERGLYENLASITLYYDNEDGNIFSSRNLRKIQEIENDLRSSQDYHLYCMTNNSSLACKSLKSIIRYFDGTFKSIDPVFDDPTFSNVPAVLYRALSHNDTRTDFEYFLPNDYSITPTVAYGSITRSEMLIGCSQSGDMKCQSDSWKDKTKAFLANSVKEKLENHLGTSQFVFYYYGYYMWLHDVIQQVTEDMMYAIGCMLFIFIFMLVHTQSLFITSLAVMSIFTSFIGTEFIYVVVIGFRYFGFFNILSIFIILGIGADDIFVFYDSWRLTELSSYPGLAHRLSDAYSKSALSMFVTSLTTCVAFFTSTISPLLATRSFGVFSGLLIMYNYMSVVVFFPTVVVMYHLKFEECTCCELCVKDNQNKENEEEKCAECTTSDDVYIIKDTGDIPSDRPINPKTLCNEKKIVLDKDERRYSTGRDRDRNGANNNFPENKDDTPTKEKKPIKKQKKIVVFFRDYYFRFVTHKVVRWILLVIFAIFVIIFGYQASKLEIDNEFVSTPVYMYYQHLHIL